MPDALTQDEALISVETRLGKDYFLLTGLSGREAVSELFEFDLDMLSSKLAVDETELVGENVTFSIQPKEGERSFFNGFISHFFAADAVGLGGRMYHARIVPWLWFLTRSANSRIFQNQSVVDIIKQIFVDHGFTDYDFRLHGTYNPYEYKVQYDETDFNFISRLLEHEGIFYFFHHENGRHTAIFGDAPSVFQPGQRSELSFFPEPGWEHIHGWHHDYEFRPGKWTLTDYDFTKPKNDLSTSQPTVVGPPLMKGYEFFEYPGLYRDRDTGTALARTRIETEEAGYHRVDGQSTVPSMRTGETFTIEHHDLLSDEVGKEYALLAVHHTAWDTSHAPTTGPSAYYSNSFVALPAKTVFRPPRKTPVPVMRGPQTATVVGPSGEEIYTDQYGRVKVQFRWDRYGKADENSSLFIRVAQTWSGNNWGGQIIPRIGMEAIVEFLEGDPDQPIITGCFHNANAMPPDTLPDNKTRSVFRTHSSPNASGFNELSFEDKAGSEQVFMHGERDQDVRIKHDAREWIGNDRHLIVTQNQLEKVGAAKNLQVANNHNEKIGGNVSLNATGDLHQKIGQNSALSAGMQVVIEAGTSITLKAGSNFIMIGPSGVTIVGSPMVMINSGGSPSPLTANPEAPQDPQQADDRQSGGTLQNAVPGQPPAATSAPPLVAETFSPQAQAMVQAAQSGAPFCPFCQ